MRSLNDSSRSDSDGPSVDPGLKPGYQHVTPAQLRAWKEQRAIALKKEWYEMQQVRQNAINNGISPAALLVKQKGDLSKTRRESLDVDVKASLDVLLMEIREHERATSAPIRKHTNVLKGETIEDKMDDVRRRLEHASGHHRQTTDAIDAVTNATKVVLERLDKQDEVQRTILERLKTIEETIMLAAPPPPTPGDATPSKAIYTKLRNRRAKSALRKAATTGGPPAPAGVEEKP